MSVTMCVIDGYSGGQRLDRILSILYPVTLVIKRVSAVSVLIICSRLYEHHFYAYKNHRLLFTVGLSRGGLVDNIKIK